MMRGAACPRADSRGWKPPKPSKHPRPRGWPSSSPSRGQPRRAPQSPHFSPRAPPRSGDSAEAAGEGTAEEVRRGGEGKGKKGKDAAGGCGHPLTAGRGPSAGLFRAEAEGAEGAARAPLTGRSRRGRAGRPPLGVREGRGGEGSGREGRAGPGPAPRRGEPRRPLTGPGKPGCGREPPRHGASWGRGSRRLSAAPRAAEGGRGVPARPRCTLRLLTAPGRGAGTPPGSPAPGLGGTGHRREEGKRAGRLRSPTQAHRELSPTFPVRPR